MVDSNFPQILDKFKIPIGLSIFGLCLIVAGVVFSDYSKQKSPEFPSQSIIKAPPINNIVIDISGAVNNPGVYKLASDDRIEDAINSANGFSSNANQEYISKYLNLAQKVSDGMKIYIPRGDEQIPTTGLTTQGVVAGASKNAVVNINTSTQAELEALPGIGLVTASKIISGRPYTKTEDLLTQKIVPKNTFEKIKDSLVLY